MRQGSESSSSRSRSWRVGVSAPFARRRLRSPTPTPAADSPAAAAPAATPDSRRRRRRPRPRRPRRLPRRRSRPRLRRLRRPFRRRSAAASGGDSRDLRSRVCPPTTRSGRAVEEPAALPPKPASPTERSSTAALFAAVRVDPTGKVVAVAASATRSPRSRRSRWVASSSAGRSIPRAKAGKPVETWASLRLDLQSRSGRREEQATLTPITPATPLPVPFEWGDDEALARQPSKPRPPTDGTVPIEQVDTAPIPKKTPGPPTPTRGPSPAKFWVKVNAAGRIEQVDPAPGQRSGSDRLLAPDDARLGAAARAVKGHRSIRGTS